MASSVRYLLGTIRDLPTIRQRLELLEKDHHLLVNQVRVAEGRLNEVTASLEIITAQVTSIHETLVEADPRMAYDIVTAVRDDVRNVLVEVTEQSNRVADALASTFGSASSIEAQPGG